MNKRNFLRLANFLGTQTHNLRVNERPYKLVAAPVLRANLESFANGDRVDRVDVEPKGLNLLNWRVAGTLTAMLSMTPNVSRPALQALRGPSDTDAFWERIDPALSALPDVQRKHFNGVGTRASVASYLLFARDPLLHPFFKPEYGRTFRYVYEVALDSGSPNELLQDYLGRGRHLLGRLSEEGVAVDDLLDLQGALYLAAKHLAFD